MCTKHSSPSLNHLKHVVIIDRVKLQRVSQPFNILTMAAQLQRSKNGHDVWSVLFFFLFCCVIFVKQADVMAFSFLLM